jgi:hypothetical protein
MAASRGGAWPEGGWSRPLDVAVKISQGNRSYQGQRETQLLDQQGKAPCDPISSAYR